MTQSLLMCPPDYYGVHYEINPWMNNRVGTVHRARAREQWTDFYRTTRRLADVHLIDPQPQVPDLVFTANAGLLKDNKFIPSRFRHPQRRREEPYFKHWFQARGYDLIELQAPFRFEGSGDALFQPGKNFLWAAHGFRTDPEAHAHLAREFQVPVVSLRLVDSQFYHLDTCFCPLYDGKVMYYPEAFDQASREKIEARTRPQDRIEVSVEDAELFALNAVLLDDHLLLNHASEALKHRLEEEGYRVCVNPVTEFLKAGGANKCLTLCLDPASKSSERGVKSAA